MAKRKRFGFGRRAKRVAGRVGRYVKRSSKAGTGQLIQLDAMAYGAVRQPLANMVLPYVPAVAGEASDEIVMGAVCWLANKYVPVAFVKNMAKKGLVIENARLGEFGASALLGGKKPDTSNSQTW